MDLYFIYYYLEIGVKNNYGSIFLDSSFVNENLFKRINMLTQYFL